MATALGQTDLNNWYHWRGEPREPQMDLKNKKIIALGERDGIQGSAIARCAESAGAKVVLEVTHCFV